MTIWTGLLLGCLLLGLVGFGVAMQHNPFRKFVLRSLDPTWHRRSARGKWSPDEIAREERDMFVSSTVMRDACDVIWDEYDPEPPDGFTGPHPQGTVVFVNTCHVARFIAEFLPGFTTPFVLVSAREENPTSEFDIDTVMANPLVLHWFMENYDFPPDYLDSGRITPLPHGLNYHKLDPQSPNQSRDMGLPSAPGAQQLDMRAIMDTLPPLRTRPLRLYCNFHLNMDTFLRHPNARRRAVARQEALDSLTGKAFVDWEPRQAPRLTVWRRHAGVSFEASPRGNSIDCHRTWEALILGTIPIVKSTQMDPIYDGLPVVIVQDWDEVSEDTLARWRAQHLPWFEAPLPPALFSNHWIARFHSFKPTGTA